MSDPEDPAVPSATVVKDGKVPGDVPKPPSGDTPGGKHKRHFSNYLLDKSLQLRYVLVVTILSALIAGSLGYLIYQQENRASDVLASGLAKMSATDTDFAELQQEATSEMGSRDQELVLKMVGVGVGLTLVLSLYLLLMTHKVAGPLYKVSRYFDEMAAGKLGPVWGLRKGDMLQDFFGSFREMHDATRARLGDDAAALTRLSAACQAAGAKDPELARALAALDAHVAARKQALS
ncbi:MAG: hypothetical protein K8W52_40580 [Deltaproteobacteria bacterium]|nr:hypothetical protein [Deltaproteobacteria bacterium]